jgi:hypothetical protein
MFQSHQVFLVLSFPFGEKMEGLVVREISFEMEKAIDILLISWRLLHFMTAGEYTDCVTSPCQSFCHFMTPLSVAARAGRGIEVREKEDPHVD